MNSCKSEIAAAETPEPKRRKRKERSDCVVPTEVLYDSIVAHFGIVAYVAIAVGISRVAVYKRIERNPELKLALGGARRTVVSVARYHLKKALHAGIDWAVQFAICRMDGLPVTSLTPPQEPKEPCEPCEPDEPREPLEEPAQTGENEPQPEVADRKTLRLIRAVERGSPWAVKYCLSHLDPGGPYEKKSRGRKPERLAAESLPAVQAQPSWMPAPVDEDVADVARTRYYELSGRPFPIYDRKPAAAAESAPLASSQPAPVNTVHNKVQEASAPDAVGIGPTAAPQTISDSRETDVVSTLTVAVKTLDEKSPFSPRHCVDVCREGEELTDTSSQRTEESRAASTGASRAEFESRSDSSTLSCAAPDRPGEIVASRSRSFAEKKTTLRLSQTPVDVPPQSDPPNLNFAPTVSDEEAIHDESMPKVAATVTGTINGAPTVTAKRPPTGQGRRTKNRARARKRRRIRAG